MRAMILSVVVAGLIVVAIFPALPGYLHPPMCSTVESGGVVLKSFCISWDPALGRYQIPPPGVPADYGAWFPATMDPVVLAVLIFVAVAITLFAAFLVIAWLRRMSQARDTRAQS